MSRCANEWGAQSRKQALRLLKMLNEGVEPQFEKIREHA
jgi:hypothetical protein